MQQWIGSLKGIASEIGKALDTCTVREKEELRTMARLTRIWLLESVYRVKLSSIIYLDSSIHCIDPEEQQYVALNSAQRV